MINVLMPMAGDGKRLKKYFDVPKPLVKLNDKFMFEVAAGKDTDAHYIFIVKDEHINKYQIDKIIKSKYDNCSIVVQYESAKGPLISSLLAKDIIDNETPLLIKDCDMYSNINISEYLNNNCDGGIATFYNNKKSYSYVKSNNFLIVEVKEKQIISNNAVAGSFFWKNGSDFIKYGLASISLNQAVNNEFYIAPVFNIAINDGKKIKEHRSSECYDLESISKVLI